MTCRTAADIFERVVAERAKKPQRPFALRYRQMERIAKRLREHADEDRFTDDLAETLPGLHALQLLQLEVIMNQWWGWSRE